jgi:hypothetical protein
MSGSNSVIMQNQEILVRNKEKQTIIHLLLMWQRFLQALWMKVLAQVQPYICVQDPKTGLMINTFLPSEKLCNGQTHRKESVRETEISICNSM